MSASGPTDAYVAKYTSAGSYLWAQHYGGASAYVNGNAVSVDRSTGNGAVAGFFYSTVNFGVGTLTSAGSADVFLLTRAP